MFITKGWYTFKDSDKDNSVTLINFFKKNQTRIEFVIQL